MAKWTIVPDADVRHVWECNEPGCDAVDGSNKTVIPPTFYEENGTPVCGCSLDMKYKRTEVNVPGAGLAKVAQALAQALEDVMASEGGEPSPNPASRRAWRAAEKSLKAWRKFPT